MAKWATIQSKDTFQTSKEEAAIYALFETELYIIEKEEQGMKGV